MTREELLKVAKPILFNTEMTKAILDGRKTVTRRVIKLKNGYQLEGNGTEITENIRLFGSDTLFYNGEETDQTLKLPYKIGDTLYVRETFRYVSIGEVDYFGECMWDDEVVQYKASQDEFNKEYEHYIGEYHEWKPSIHMPKDLARIFLKVTDVRVERLQDIWASDTSKEGISYTKPTSADEMISAFSDLWNSTINKRDFDKYGWESNPFVWVIEFERVVVE